ncbi:ATP-binding protein [Kitasatospora aureofaciens]|nr:ATP-binding protein [Kitasatospora aureofaciens]
MPNIRLLHLTFAGSGRRKAQVIFGEKLTVIYGASDTGKSFVTETIDYMLGARKLDLIPEAEGYSQILLGLTLPDGSVITLMRGLQASRVYVFEEDIRDLVYRAPDLDLGVSPRGSKNISRYLLEKLGLEGTVIATNDTGGTKLVGFRDLLHLCLVNETRMVSKVPPVLRSTGTSGQTAHKSVLKLLLTGQGEPVTDARPNAAQRRLQKGKIGLLDELILDLQRQLDPQGGNESELAAQLQRLLAHQDTVANSLREITVRHTAAAARRADIAITLGQYDQRLAEIDDLLGRFGLLRSQYESDLARLAMVSEAGNLLGYFRTGKCVFCGADPEHQTAKHDQETTALHAAIAAESDKTRHLLSDLRLTMDDLQIQRGDVAGQREHSAAQAEQADREIGRIAEELLPVEHLASEAMAARSRLEKELGLHQRIQELQEVRDQLVADGAVPGGRPTGSIPAGTVAAFDRAIERALETWHVQLNNVSYDQYTAELFVGNRGRTGHGKGMRAVLHAAFAVGLADYCLGEGHTHPGFIILDSPLVTYRQPVAARRTDDENLPDSVSDYFYRDLFHRFTGQAIVVENTDPPADIAQEAQVYMFSRDPEDHRFGFFPVGGAALDDDTSEN